MENKYTLELNHKIYPVYLIAKPIKTVIVKVDYINRINLHYPNSYPKKQAIAHLYKQIDWLEKVVNRNEVNMTEMQVVDVIANRKIWLFGQLYNIQESQGLEIFSIKDQTLYVYGEIKLIIQKIRLSLIQKIVDEFNLALEHFKTSLINVKPTLTFRKMTSRWGSCNIKNSKITLNILLVHVPLFCIQYVIIHEFVHLIHPNHGHGFYLLLEKLFPEYKKAVKELNKYSFILRI